MLLRKISSFGDKITRSFSFPMLPEPRRFLVITRGRTGSQLLGSLLNSHPFIRVRGEVIGESVLQEPSRKREILKVGPVRYVRQCFRRRLFESAVGIKILYYQVEHNYAQTWGVSGLPEVLDFLKSQKDIRIIHLKRRNHLKTLASIHVALLTNKYKVKDPTEGVDHVRIRLTTRECEKEFSSVSRWERFYDEVFRGHKMLEVHYETLIAERQRECDRILDFLSIPRRTLKTALRKQRNRPLSEVVENYDELERHFSRTEWARFFE